MTTATATSGYIVKHLNGRWDFAEDGGLLAHSLDRESLRGPVNVSVALRMAVGDRWTSDCGNTFVVEGIDTSGPEPKIAVRRENARWDKGLTYHWHPGSFGTMQRVA